MKQLITTGMVLLVLAGLLVLPAGAADTTDYAKVYVIPLTVRETGVTPGTVTLMYGHGPALGLQSGPFKGELADTQGKAVKTFQIWDPRIRFGDTAYVNADGKVSAVSGILEKADVAEVTLIVPFSKDYAVFMVKNEKGTEMISVELSPVMKKFCAANPGDPDCSSSQSSPLVLFGGAVLVLLIAAGAGWYFLKKKKGTA